MNKSTYPQSVDIQHQDTLKVSSIQPPKPQILDGIRRLKFMDAVCVLLPLLSLFLWSISLQHISVYNMNDLGLISVLSPRIILALMILIIGFGCTLQRPRMKVAILALHVIILIVILYGTENIIEEAPHIATVYRHAGYIEYILRTGKVLPDFDVYSSWPVFFILGALVTRVAGYQTILSYAGYAPVFFNLLYFGPMYMIFTSVTANKRLVWLGLWFFYLTNWVQQDYYSPQGLNLFLYLIFIAILVKWFKIPPKGQVLVQKQRWQSSGLLSRFVAGCLDWLKDPDPFIMNVQTWQRQALLASLILIFALMVSSHPLTPISALASVIALVIFRRCRPFWLPILMAIMLAAWFFTMGQSFLAGHSDMVVGTVGKVSSNVSSSVTARTSQGDPQHQFIALARVMMTAFIWLLALLGAVRRLRNGFKDLTYILLAVTPFAFIVVGDYGGEMFLRIYFFSLPLMVFFAAALFYNKYTLVMRKSSLVLPIAIITTSLVLLSGFFFTRYGNENLDYMTYKEVDSIQYLYNTAPPNSLFIEAWNDVPWEYQGDDKYTYISMTDINPSAIININIGEVIKYIKSQKHSSAYLIFTRSSRIQAYSLYGFPKDRLDKVEEAMLKTGEFKLVYNNSDAQIYMFIGSAKGGGSR